MSVAGSLLFLFFLVDPSSPPLTQGGAWTTAAGGRHPLTQLLKSSFTDVHAATLVLATASPAAKDTEHSLNTLRHACVMDGRRTDGPTGGASHIRGGETRTEDIGEVDVRAAQASRGSEMVR